MSSLSGQYSISGVFNEFFDEITGKIKKADTQLYGKAIALARVSILPDTNEGPISQDVLLVYVKENYSKEIPYFLVRVCDFKRSLGFER